MKKLAILLFTFFLLSLSSCIIVDNSPGPNGRDGFCYFGIDYDHHPPYSYWDNNKSIPFNPILGEYYNTYPGIYHFEYFINDVDYWYGTYQVFVNRGGPGLSDGRPGKDGVDSYLLLICDPNGYYEYRDNWKLNSNEPVTIDKQIGEFYYKITLQKGCILNRPAHSPKFLK